MHEKLRVELRKVQPIVERHNEAAARLGIIKCAYYYVRDTHKPIRDAYISESTTRLDASAGSTIAKPSF